jgi:hypothetical protein
VNISHSTSVGGHIECSMQGMLRNYVILIKNLLHSFLCGVTWDSHVKIILGLYIMLHKSRLTIVSYTNHTCPIIFFRHIGDIVIDIQSTRPHNFQTRLNVMWIYENIIIDGGTVLFVYDRKTVLTMTKLLYLKYVN